MPLPAPLILASASPRRKELLKGLGLDFEIIIADIDESPIAGESPVEYCKRAAFEKAKAISAKNPAAITLGADTTVIVDGEILGKPENKEHAAWMLGRISGRWHTVISAFALIYPQRQIEVKRTVSSDVFIRELSDAQINWYIETGEPMDKAGSYAIQGVGASLVREVKGSYTCVVGLPLAETVKELESLFGPDCLLGD